MRVVFSVVFALPEAVGGQFTQRIDPGRDAVEEGLVEGTDQVDAGEIGLVEITPFAGAQAVEQDQRDVVLPVGQDGRRVERRDSPEQGKQGFGKVRFADPLDGPRDGQLLGVGQGSPHARTRVFSGS